MKTTTTSMPRTLALFIFAQTAALAERSTCSPFDNPHAVFNRACAQCTSRASNACLKPKNQNLTSNGANLLRTICLALPLAHTNGRTEPRPPLNFPTQAPSSMQTCARKLLKSAAATAAAAGNSLAHSRHAGRHQKPNQATTTATTTIATTTASTNGAQHPWEPACANRSFTFSTFSMRCLAAADSASAALALFSSSCAQATSNKKKSANKRLRYCPPRGERRATSSHLGCFLLEGHTATMPNQRARHEGTH